MNVWDSEDWQPTTMKKILILECDDMHLSQQFEIDVPYDWENRQLDLGQSLHHVLQVLDCHQQRQIFYFHPLHHHFVYAGVFPFKFRLIIGEDFIQTPQITVKVRKFGAVEAEGQSFVSKEAKQIQKKKRVSERTIREVLDKVSTWRQISQKNPKVNLQDAAKQVAIPKKTLDDYFAQIKLASEYGFDFKNNLDQKIGALRKFVRENHMKKKNYNELNFLDSLLKRQQHSDDDQQQQE